jgi:hypothetical protein
VLQTRCPSLSVSQLLKEPLDLPLLKLLPFDLLLLLIKLRTLIPNLTKSYPKSTLSKLVSFTLVWSLRLIDTLPRRYSDSDDEAHEKKVAAFPRWAQSPVLTHQLLEQQKINPDDIFGPIPALSIAGTFLSPVSPRVCLPFANNWIHFLLADMFRNTQSTARLRVRTSSAQWDGTDALTRTDMERYHKAMGFTKTTTSNLGASTSSSTHNNTYETEGPAPPRQ